MAYAGEVRKFPSPPLGKKKRQRKKNKEKREKEGSNEEEKRESKKKEKRRENEKKITENSENIISSIKFVTLTFIFFIRFSQQEI